MANYLDNVIFRQMKDLTGIQEMLKRMNPDVTIGSYGEQSRLAGMVGSGIAAAGGGTRGTYQKLPLFNLASDFAGQRMTARNAAEQARMMGMLNANQAMNAPIQALLQNRQLGLQEKQMKWDQAFNWGDILGLFNFTANMGNPLAALGGLFGSGGNANMSNLPGMQVPAAKGEFNTLNDLSPFRSDLMYYSR